MFDESKHIKLLAQFPYEYFSSCQNIIKKIEKQHTSGTNIRGIDIAHCYNDLAQSLCPNSALNKHNPHTDYITDSCLRFFDYINPDSNKFITKNDLSKLPKSYRNAVNTMFGYHKPSNIAVFVIPKKGVSFKQANTLKNDFVYVGNLKNRLPGIYDHLDRCYESLQLLTNETEFVVNKRYNTSQGSIILCQELLDLLFNTGIMTNAQRSIRNYTQNAEHIRIVRDISAHKRAMFGELQR